MVTRGHVLAAALLFTCAAVPAAVAQTAGGANNNNAGVNRGPAVQNQRVTNEGAAGMGAIMTVSPSGVREIQQQLNRIGYDAGPVDGTWNRQTAEAMLHFQQARGLEPTGNLNFASIAALGLTDNIITHPIGSGNQLSTTGAPPPRGEQSTSGASVPSAKGLPSQRITNEAPSGGQAGGAGAGGGAAGRR